MALRTSTLRSLGVLLLASASPAMPATPSAPSVPADTAVSEARLSLVTQALASDAFEGRAPGTRGEDRTIAYLIQQFRALGLQPGGAHGGWTQAVDLVRTQMPADATMSVAVAGERIALVQNREVAALTLRPVDRVRIKDAPLVFVGYGVAAPERHWDDYKGADLRG